MSLASGLKSQLGFAIETTAGTRNAPTNFVEYTQESLRLTVQRIDRRGLRAGRRTLTGWSPGVQEVTGQIMTELAPQGSGKLFRAMFGAVSTTGSNPYTHTFTPGNLADDTLTVQINKPDIAGTDRVFEYTGCSVTSWEIASNVNEFVMLTLDLYALNEDRSQSLASATYPATYTPFTFAHGSLSIAAGAQDVRSIVVRGDNGLATGRHQIRATTPARPKPSLEANFRSYGGQILADFDGLTAYERFVNGTEAALSLTFNAGTSAQLTIAGNVRFDGETPVVTGPELLELPLPFTFVHSTSDASAITATLINADSAP